MEFNFAHGITETQVSLRTNYTENLYSCNYFNLNTNFIEIDIKF